MIVSLQLMGRVEDGWVSPVRAMARAAAFAASPLVRRRLEISQLFVVVVFLAAPLTVLALGWVLN